MVSGLPSDIFSVLCLNYRVSHVGLCASLTTEKVIVAIEGLSVDRMSSETRELMKYHSWSDNIGALLLTDQLVSQNNDCSIGIGS
jgi:hypothetical protein